ncbi:MAG: putative lipid II flippase FtsW [Baekduia sp.]
MEQRRRPKRTIEYDLLLTATLCLLAAGAVMVFSASSARSLLSGQGSGFEYLIRYGVFAAIGLGVMFAVARYPLERITPYTGHFLIGAIVLTLAVRVPGLGVEAGGAKRWLGAGPLTFQPSELMKVGLVLYAAKVLSARPEMMEDWRELRPFVLLTGAAVVAVALQPDLGTALVCAFAMGSMLIAAGIPMRWLGALGGGGAALVLAYSSTAQYRMERLTSFLDPWAHASDAGFQAVQGLIAVGSGGLVGKGIGQSQQKNLFLPEAHTDFILAIVGEETGALGIIVLLGLYGMLAFAGLRIAQQARSRYTQLLAGGLIALYIGQAMLNVFTVLGLAPLTGVPLPFISYGGTTLITMLAAIGLVLGISRESAAGAARSAPPRDARPSTADGAADDRDRHRWDSGARRAGAVGRRRAAS